MKIKLNTEYLKKDIFTTNNIKKRGIKNINKYFDLCNLLNIKNVFDLDEFDKKFNEYLYDNIILQLRKYEESYIHNIDNINKFVKNFFNIRLKNSIDISSILINNKIIIYLKFV